MGTNNREEPVESMYVEGRNAVLETLRSDATVERIFVQKALDDGPIRSILRDARKRDIRVQFVEKERLDQLSETGHHQGVIAQTAAAAYATVEEMITNAREAGEAPFLVMLDGIQDPHNLGAIIRSAHQAGCHGVILPKQRAVGLTPTAMRASAGAAAYTPVARVTNLVTTMEELKKEGLWFACADMDGEVYHRANLSGPFCLVVGSEGDGVSRLVREHCDFTVSIPMKGKIDSLNASVAAGILLFEAARQRDEKK